MASPTVERIRGRRLQAIRRYHLLNNPLCVACKAKGLIELATEVDHIIALCNGGQDIDSNRQGLCHKCHAIKTAKDMGYTPRPTIGADGWPV